MAGKVTKYFEIRGGVVGGECDTMTVSGREALFPKCDEISSSSFINLFANHRLSAVSLRLTAGSDRQPGGWSAPATLDGPVGVASTTTTTKLKLFQT